MLDTNQYKFSTKNNYPPCILHFISLFLSQVQERQHLFSNGDQTLK